MKRMLLALLAGAFLMNGCGAPKAPANAPAPTQNTAAPATPEPAVAHDEDGDEGGAVTELVKRELGPFKVRAIQTGDLSDGHFNFYVTGGDIKAVRSWVGDEAATGAMVTKANWEDDHYCAHIEMPTPIPADATLWYEIESNDGKTEKASVALNGRSSNAPATRNFAAQKIGPYDVQPFFEEEIENGHYSLRVNGAEFKAVRIWVGPEDASGVIVVKTEVENDYQHGHVEVPTPLPADAVLWIEIENPTGETFKGSTPLKVAS